MPKIKTISVQIENEYQTYIVWFKKSYFFIKDLPTKFITVSEFSNRSETLNDLENRFHSAIRKYVKAVKTTEKVIIIKFIVGKNMVTKDTNFPGHYSIDDDHPLYNFVSFGYSGINDYGFIIDYETAYKRIVDDNIGYYSITITADGKEHEGHKRHIDKGEIIIPYSEANEQYFKEIKNSLMKMVIRIGDFFKQDKDIILKLIETKQRLLSE